MEEKNFCWRWCWWRVCWWHQAGSVFSFLKALNLMPVWSRTRRMAQVAKCVVFSVPCVVDTWYVIICLKELCRTSEQVLSNTVTGREDQNKSWKSRNLSQNARLSSYLSCIQFLNLVSLVMDSRTGCTHNNGKCCSLPMLHGTVFLSLILSVTMVSVLMPPKEQYQMFVCGRCLSFSIKKETPKRTFHIKTNVGWNSRVCSCVLWSRIAVRPNNSD